MQKGIGIFTKSVKFADFPSAETAKLRSGLPPSTALTRGTGTSPRAKASSRPRRPSGFAVETQTENSPRHQNEKNPENWQLVLDKCKTTGIITNVRQANIAGLCNGSTADSDSVCEGSNPSPAARESPEAARLRDFSSAFYPLLYPLTVLSFSIDSALHICFRAGCTVLLHFF